MSILNVMLATLLIFLAVNMKIHMTFWTVAGQSKTWHRYLVDFTFMFFVAFALLLVVHT